MNKYMLREKIKRLLHKNSISRSSNRRFNGLYNKTVGFFFERIDDEYLIYWTWGTLSQNTISEIDDSKTQFLHTILLEEGLGKHVQYKYYENLNRYAIRLLP